MKKWLIILLIIIVTSSNVSADGGDIETYFPGEVFDLSIHLTNNTGDVLGASCALQIRNESNDVILNADLNELEGGWYNYTYNTSKLGKYLCRQNCTATNLFAAETCDFIIGGQDKMLLGVIVAIPMFIALFLLAFSWFLPVEKYWALKLILPLGAMFFIFQSYHLGVIAISEFYGSNNLINAIGDNTYIFGWVVVIIITVFLITFIYDIFMMFDTRKHKTGKYEEEHHE